MNEQELKSLWSQQVLTPPVPMPDAEIVARIKKKMRKFDRTIFWRDVREWVACVFVVYSYHGMWVRAHSALGRAGCMVVMVSAVVVATVIFFSRRKEKPSDGASAVREYVQAEVRKVDRQIRLLSSVLWWYILPLMVGAEMYALGESADVTDKVVLTGVFVFVAAIVWWVNQYAVKKSLKPLKTELEKTLNAGWE